ncbi:MAG: S41 family peptidase [Bacteroidetes bacterium]|nr:S41 family peptidase [Bacteroidota bacterium]
MSRFSKIYYFPIYIAITLIVGIYVGKSLPAGVSSSLGGSSRSDSLANEIYNLAEMLELVKDNYVDSVDVTKIAQKGINDLLKQLDPHSVYVPASMVEKMNESLKGSFEGIGMEFTMFDDTVVVVKPIIGGPSEKVGLQPGDKILKVEGKNIAGLGIKSEDIIKKLRGKRGSTVNISVWRKGEAQLLTFSITRAEIPIHSVDAAYMLDSATAYFRISDFAENTIQEMKASYPYSNPKVKNVIIDLRNNGGGYLNTCIDLADEFLKADELVVYTDDRQHKEKKMFATEKGQFEKAKVFVLINSESASASEIFAGAIQDNDRGLLIGERTFGKGLVQEVFPLSDGGQMRLTVSRYYTPSGRCIQRDYKGVEYEDYSTLRFDESKTDTTKVFFTKNKRKVYACGGVLPDVVMHEDTTLMMEEIAILYEDDFIRKMALQYYLDHKKELKALTPEKFMASGLMQMDIKKYVQRHLVQSQLLKSPLNAASQAFILKEVNAVIAKSAWDSNAYYKVLLQNDRHIAYVLRQLR